MAKLVRIRALIGLVAAIGLLLGGCAATTPADETRTGSALADQSAESPSWAQSYIARVNQQARQRGVRVHWINPPRDRDRPSSQETRD